MPMIFKCGRCGKLDDGRPNGAEAATLVCIRENISPYGERLCEECHNNLCWWWGFAGTKGVILPPRNAPMEGEIVVRQNPTLLGDINDVCNRDAKRQKIDDAPKMIETYTGNSCRECSGNQSAPGLCDLHSGLRSGCGNPLDKCDCLKCRRAKAGRCSDPDCPGQCPKCITLEALVPEAASCTFCGKVLCVCKPESRGGISGRR
jgi:hypothetical protein